MGRIVLPEPRALAFRYQRQRQDVQPTDGMANYRPQDIGAALALAEHVRDEYALPLAQAVYKRGVGDPMMEAAKRRTKITTKDARTFEAPEDLGPIAMGVGNKEDVESAVGASLRPEYVAATTPPFVKRNLPIMVKPQIPQPPDPQDAQGGATAPTQAQAPAAGLDRPAARGSVTVAGGVRPIEVPGVQRQVLSDAAQAGIAQIQQPAQQAPAEIPSYGLDFDDKAIYSQDELSSLVASARQVGDPESKARVAALIDRQPMHDAVPQSFTEFFSGAHVNRRREELKKQLGMEASAAGSAADPLKLAEFRRKEADSAARRPGWQADSQRKGVEAGFARVEEEQEAFQRDLDNDLKQYALIRGQYGAASAQANAMRAAIKAKYGAQMERSTIARNFASAGLDRERAETDRTLRAPRKESIEAGTGLAKARTASDEAFRDPRVANINAQTGMYGRMPAAFDSVRASWGQSMDLDERLAKLRGELAGRQKWIADNPEYAGSGPNIAGVTKRTNVSTDFEAAQRELSELEKKRPEVKADIERIKKEIEEVEKLRRGMPTASGGSASATSSRPAGTK